MVANFLRNETRTIIKIQFWIQIWLTFIWIKSFHLNWNRPRLLSLSVIRDIDVPSDSDTTFVMQYGQFIDRTQIIIFNSFKTKLTIWFTKFSVLDDMLETMESKSGNK